MTITLQALVDFQPKIMLCNAPNKQAWNVRLPSNIVRMFVDVQGTSMTAFHGCKWAPAQVRYFPKFWRANWSRTATAFRTFCHASGIYFIQQPVYPSPCPILPRKLSQQTLWRKKINQRAIAFTDLTYTVQNHYKIRHLICLLSFAIWHHFCTPRLIQINLKVIIENEISLICAKFCADLIYTFKVTSRKTEWPRFWATL